MRIFGLVFVMLFGFSALADAVTDALKNVAKTDLNGRCSVIYEEGKYIQITGSEQRPQKFGMPENAVKREGGILTLTYANYDGDGEVYFIEKFNSDGSFRSYMVVGTWNDNDNSYDQSAFCELYTP